MTALDRDDIITGLREFIAELRAADQVAGIRLVGGSALALRYFDRGTTQDLDSLHVRPGSDEVVAAAASRVARRHDWDQTWLNFEVTKADALPTLGRVVAWESIYDQDGIVIQVGVIGSSERRRRTHVRVSSSRCEPSTGSRTRLVVPVSFPAH
ncbi:hypothetical protein [Glaciihabitans sp. UYNi722]|uniref:hypothetical protein n=1 Tax=Glaciihabitans sp. UYNi722 TaxID=3156344 RepID=UPI0033932DFA